MSPPFHVGRLKGSTDMEAEGSRPSGRCESLTRYDQNKLSDGAEGFGRQSRGKVGSL